MKPIADSQQDPQTSATDFLNASTVYRLNAGDNVRMKVQQTSGGNLTVIASSGGAETSPELVDDLARPSLTGSAASPALRAPPGCCRRGP